MMKQQNNKKCFLRRTSFKVMCAVFSILLVIIATVSIVLNVGRKKMHNNQSTNIIVPDDLIESNENDGKTITYKGDKYKYNENITSILLMGIDRDNMRNESEGIYGNNGQADLIMLIVVDTSNGDIKAIPISRDTMIDIDIYSKSGKYLGVKNKQICLSYAYGDGRHTSCENTVLSVSRLFYGMPVNSYVSIDINTIKQLNDAIGGVTVTLDEDTFISDKYFKKGEKVTLKGEYATSYIRSRDQVAVDANNFRMKRQKNYMISFFNKSLSLTKKDITLPIKLYNKISNRKVSNLSVADISYLTSCVLKNKSNTNLKFESISGTVSMGEKYAEFNPNKEALYDLVVKTFYKPIKSEEN